MGSHYALGCRFDFCLAKDSECHDGPHSRGLSGFFFHAKYNTFHFASEDVLYEVIKNKVKGKVKIKNLYFDVERA